MLFPQAKVIHVTRHGVDVAASLRARLRRHFELFPADKRPKRLTEDIVLEDDYSIMTGRCVTLEGAFSLWELYNGFAKTFLTPLNGHKLEISFERLAEDPIPICSRMAAFCGLDATPESIERASSTVRQSRAFVYRTDPELTDFAGGVADRLARFGYRAD